MSVKPANVPEPEVDLVIEIFGSDAPTAVREHWLMRIFCAISSTCSFRKATPRLEAKVRTSLMRAPPGIAKPANFGVNGAEIRHADGLKFAI
jgi:hypothetical protein